jgi:general stress protein 26
MLEANAEENIWTKGRRSSRRVKKITSESAVPIYMPRAIELWETGPRVPIAVL